MFFPFKIVVRREIFGGTANSTHTMITIAAFWRVWEFQYTRATKLRDREFHWMKELM